MAINVDTFSHTVSRIYDCSIDPSGWGDTLAAICNELNGAFTSVLLHEKTGAQLRHIIHSPFDEKALDDLHRNYVTKLPNFHAVLEGDIDVPSITSRSLPPEAFEECQFFVGWAKPLGLYDGCTAKYFDSPVLFGTFSFVTGAAHGPVQDDQATFVNLIAPHIRRAMLIGKLIDGATLISDDYRALIDAMATPVILTDGSGQCFYINASAESIVRDTPHLSLSRGKISVRDGQMRKLFNDALARAASGDLALGRRGIGIPLAQNDSSAPVAYLLPLASTDKRRGFSSARVAVFLTCRQTHALPDIAIVMTLFDLTAAEAKVLLCLARGLSVTETATELCIGVATVRTHLSHVFSKTGTSRQAELLMLLGELRNPYHHGTLR